MPYYLMLQLLSCVYNLHYDYANNNNRKKGAYFTMCLRD